MESKILFLAPYPTPENIKDGMINRVRAIDLFFMDTPRTYLQVSLKRFVKKTQYKDGNAQILELNLLFHLFSILHIIRSHDYIYSHSIYMLKFLWLFVCSAKAHLTLDIHGVVPEEEQNFHGNPQAGVYFNFIEKKIFKKLSNAVCVTNSMKKYYEKKYPFYKGKYIIYSIMPTELVEYDLEAYNRIKTENKQINVIYSGGIQGWQNIDMMMQLIANNQSSRIHYTILTGNIEKFEEKVTQYKIPLENITLVSRPPQELWKDYLSADYAFILRDDNIVNRVANPTKLVEYLYYGIVPIVLSPFIGDYYDLGYEFIDVRDFSKDSLVKPRNLNQKNKHIVKTLMDNNKNTNIYKQVFD